MRTYPALRALRGDPASQRQAQERALAARNDWRTSPHVAGALKDLAAFGGGAELPECTDLAALLEPSAAAGFVKTVLDVMAEAIRDEPLVQIPFRHSYAGGYAVLHLAQEGAATLALVMLEPGERPPARTIAFADCERHETIISGQATGDIFTRGEHDGWSRIARTFQAGDRCCTDAQSSRLIRCVSQSLVSLRLSRSPERPLPSSEHSLADGTVLHRSAGSPDESRRELMITLLGAMGRTDAAPLLAELSSGEGEDSNRWHALRHALALDSAIGFRALCALAERCGDPLAKTADALRQQLEHSYPALSRREVA